MSSKIRSIGAHLRLKTSYSELAQEALQLNLKSFQFFLLPQDKNRYPRLTQTEITAFHTHAKKFSSIFVHSSYWINLATGKKESALISKRLLKKELQITQTLGLTYLVLHPGSAKGHPKTAHDPLGKIAGMQAVANVLNEMAIEFPEITILLENTAHKGQSIGSDLHDFAQLKLLLDHPQRIGFCLDFAHAHCYGYNLAKSESFLKLVNDTIGLESVALIHLNDSVETAASHKDHHEIPGKGTIGKKTLATLIKTPAFAGIPIICELPIMENESITNIINEILYW